MNAPASHRRSRRVFVVVVIGLAASLTWALWGGRHETPDPGQTRTPHPKTPQPAVIPPLALSDSPFLNTTKAASYVGSESCEECHVDEHASYLHTTHSRAFNDVHVENEPADDAFLHALSGRRYEVYRDGQTLRHRETLDDPQGRELARSDYALKYLIGSGAHTRSYLVEADGFLVESPITWYSSKQDWAMSPGYDRPAHWGFERAVTTGCLICHVGRAAPVEGSYQRAVVHEQAIGCESCHGPGSLHVKARHAEEETGEEQTGEEFDPTIVNPKRLSRQLQEDICAQCHLRADATVTVRTRQLSDFRPGLPLTDVRIDYRIRASEAQMKVVGHVEQMWLSPCYQNTKTFTCAPCHNPHQKAPVKNPPEVYNRKCAECHENDACGMELFERLKRSQADSCIFCHMPQVETDLPHVAFTHHRVGVHRDRAGASSAPPVIGELEPFGDVSRHSAPDLRRSLGLAYLEAAAKQPNASAHHTYRARGAQLLQQVQAEGANDPDVASALARLHWEENDVERAIAIAQAALRSPDLSTEGRVNALFVLGDSYARTGRPEQAIPVLEELTGLRRHSEDWLLLGLARRDRRELEKSLEALRKSAEIAPFRPEPIRVLADHYSRAGNQSRARELREKADALDAARNAVIP